MGSDAIEQLVQTVVVISRRSTRYWSHNLARSKSTASIHLQVVRVKVLEEGLKGRAGGPFDVNLATVALLEPSTEHGPEVFTRGIQMGPVGEDTLLLHHKANVIKGAGIQKVPLDIRYKGGLE
jgi:hypothetical protein